MAEKERIPNALTIDVEDYFQVAALAEAVRYDDWSSMEYRVEANTDRILGLFDQAGVKATFFTLGWVAERSPQLVKRIAQAGHEVASHGYSHQLIYNQTPDVFAEETRRSKGILEDILGTSVTGYRAASYSITNQSRWALDILAEQGFTWDSSIFPVRHDRYGMPGTPRWPHRLTTDKGYELAEFPLSTLKLPGYTLPIAGGGYFRLFPYWFSRYGLGSINRQGRPFVFYLHPWEVDPDQPRLDVKWLSRFRHYNNLDVCEERLARLLSDFRFTTMSQVLESEGLLAPDPDHANTRSVAGMA
ncbi:polysaccharide deacetylase family protein, PEP-CTERM locus subfamily [Marinobacter gudaonensis]|uniref:Polysaccharide deacetylase family protein, PEP-CTERM locus subfamily n=1 Tax=Marinobacter gudaonensis TaxID=375760 RepID=A0A1I6GDX7_9GAMM|nr:XrtA system polysaccharide deacetylase [Marinobacter gudaonensis]SFR40321.1 polysaccharide deacetylase family protein, PEP-CTERM locus subfamily [Marinobacter gudaonensis]